MKKPWFYLSCKDLEMEKQQLVDEGRDISSIESEMNKLLNLKDDKELSYQSKLNDFLDKSIKLPDITDYKYFEPSDLKGIRKARPKGSRKLKVKIKENELYDKILGAWLGRCSGCLLGKPVEGWKSKEIWGYLKDLKKYPLNDYFHSNVSEKIIKKYKINKNSPFINKVKYMVEDDDINYTVIGLAVMKQYGKDFTPYDVATFWLQNLPILHTCTAETVAYRNFVMSILPPESAIFRNPYREWIGAQIRADLFGYVCLGHPELASEFAWRDACLSHIKNGIYGEMWVAAMIAVAPFISDIRKIIEIGLTEIPKNCRLSDNIKEVISWYEAGIDFEEVISRIHKKWDENNRHHWCHTISNAQIVALGLLWGEGDFEKSICRAVQACFDTDCNGATVGSIIGMMKGASKLPEKWIKPLNDKVETGVSGYHLVNISQLAKESCELYKKVQTK
ncbi:MAG: ADP-ribosylglycohydrolase family protein [Candidatus Firestonebacteria bacterium]